MSGDRADQLALRPENGAQHRDLGVQIFLLDHPIGPRAAYQLFPADDASALFEQGYQHVEGAPAELDRPAVGEELAAMRLHPETTERNARRRFGETFHQLHKRGPPQISPGSARLA